MSEVKYIIRAVEWDTDGEEEEVDLPSEFCFTRSELLEKGIIEEGDDEEAVFDALSDYISDETGYCHTGFESAVEND